jgi:uncharacterized protein (TIRG00374 family)
LLNLYGAGLFSNNFLPTGMGGDAVRASLLARYIPTRQAFLSVGYDRVIGLFALIALLIVGVWLGVPPIINLKNIEVDLPAGIIMKGLIFTVIFVVVIISLYPHFTSTLRSKISNYNEAIISFIKTQRTITELYKWLIFVGVGIFFSVISHFGIVASHWLLFLALGLITSLDAVIWMVLISSVSVVIPISINGLGLQESLYIILLSSYGISQENSLLIALLFRAFMVAFSVLGGMFSLTYRPSKLLSSLGKQ